MPLGNTPDMHFSLDNRTAFQALPIDFLKFREVTLLQETLFNVAVLFWDAQLLQFRHGQLSEVLYQEFMITIELKRFKATRLQCQVLELIFTKV